MFKNSDAIAFTAGGSLGAVLALAIPLIIKHEGYKPTAYLDPVGVPTICYGHTQGVKLGQTKTQAECKALLEGDLGQALAAIDRYVKVDLPDTRRAALASFVYNVGAGNFKNSTLLKKLNTGDSAGACAELSRWIYAGGVQYKGLVKRRAEERALCEVGL